MRQSHSQVNTLLIVVAVLAVVGGLAIVAATSPQSFQFNPLAWFAGPASPTLAATEVPTATATTVEPTATVTATPTRRPTSSALALVTSTSAAPSDTPGPTVSPTATPIDWPTNTVALAEVVVQEAVNGRVRDLPNGDTVIAIVPNGTLLYVLDAQQQIGNVIWLQVLLPDGQTGWMADFLLKTLYQRP